MSVPFRARGQERLRFSSNLFQIAVVPSRKPLPEHELAICNRLKEALVARAFPRTVCARTAGLNVETLRNYESGRTALPALAGVAVCDSLKINKRWLAFGFSGPDFEIPPDLDPKDFRLFSEFTAKLESRQPLADRVNFKVCHSLAVDALQKLLDTNDFRGVQPALVKLRSILQFLCNSGPEGRALVVEKLTSLYAELDAHRDLLIPIRLVVEDETSAKEQADSEG